MRPSHSRPVDPLPVAISRKPRELTPDERDTYEIGEERALYRERWEASRTCRRLETLAGMLSADPDRPILRGMLKAALEAIVNSLSEKPAPSVLESTLECVARAVKTANISDAELRELLPEYDDLAGRVVREER